MHPVTLLVHDLNVRLVVSPHEQHSAWQVADFLNDSETVRKLASILAWRLFLTRQAASQLEGEHVPREDFRDVQKHTGVSEVCSQYSILVTLKSYSFSLMGSQEDLGYPGMPYQRCFKLRC